MKQSDKEKNTGLGEIDMVYLWVDGNDPVWQAKRNAVIGKTEVNSAVNCDGRYADNDELKYSLRSLEKYAPWIRKIFIVTDGQTPRWLDTSNPRIRIVDHSEILPPQSLPCFNSPIIEHSICNIPDLSERFLYGNDDMFFNRPVSPDMFFGPDGFPIARLNRRPFRKLTDWLSEHVLGRKMSHYNKKIRNAARLVEREFGKFYGCKTHHNIDAYLKSDMKHVEELFRKDIEPTLEHHVRNDKDIQRNVFTYVALAEKRVHPRYVSQKESLRIHIQNKKHYAKLEKYNPLLFCVNDSEYADDEARRHVRKFLEERFPDKSQFEK